MAAKKTKSKVNQAGNYTKPTMRAALFKKIRLALRVETQGNGQPVKHNYLLFNIRRLAEDISNGISQISKVT
jgi:hypothetical protein